jgi:hypothetical protein
VLDAELAEAGQSRVSGGIHYPFDIAAGQALGRATAQWGWRTTIGRVCSSRSGWAARRRDVATRPHASMTSVTIANESPAPISVPGPLTLPDAA